MNNFEQWLISDYKDNDIHPKLRDKLENRKKRLNESYKDYLENKIALFRLFKLPFDEKYLSYCILEGLNDNTRSEIIKHVGSYPDLKKLKKIKFPTTN